MSFLTPVRCNCRKVIQVTKFLNCIEKQKKEREREREEKRQEDDIDEAFEPDYSRIFDEDFKKTLLPCCKTKYLNILSNIKKEEILLMYETE